MKQPELGKKILELRKQKGFTQEELVEKCNINVRTIQRIEAGDVSPRSFTIKAILEVLGFNYEEVLGDEYVPGKFDKLLRINPNTVNKQLNTAWVFGIVYFMVGFVEFAFEFMQGYFENRSLYIIFYTVTKLITISSLFFFIRGFVIAGSLYKNHLLQMSSFLLLSVAVLSTIADITTLFAFEEFSGLITASIFMSMGVLMVFFGVAILRLKNQLGDIAKYTGVLEIVTGICFFTILLSPIGAFTLIVVEILEIILIYKVALRLKKVA
ncbi:helix-turn-helix domain-containing protein [Polaribacter pacificus]|nr:helix-turn-helix transcriptional regulator [Polaribacter pacificus]